MLCLLCLTPVPAPSPAASAGDAGAGGNTQLAPSIHAQGGLFLSFIQAMLVRELTGDPEDTTLRLLYTTPESLAMERLR